MYEYSRGDIDEWAKMDVQPYLDAIDKYTRAIAQLWDYHPTPRLTVVPTEALAQLRALSDCSGPLSCLREHVDAFLSAVDAEAGR